MRFFMIIISSRMFSCHSFGQRSNISKVDNMLWELSRQNLFSGAVLIADSSGVIFSDGYGFADRERQIVNTPDTRFSLSSGSKVLAGTAITYLAQLGKLNFADTVGKYIEGLPKGDIITIHQILTHSAGFNDFYNAYDFSYHSVKNCTDMLRFMRSMPLVYNPGDSTAYSTGDAIILGAIIEKITGMSFQEYIQKTFFEPLKMEDTSFTPYWQLKDSQTCCAVGYEKTETGIARKPYNYDPDFVILSAGGVWSSVTDLYRFDKAVFTSKIVNAKYLDLMTSPYTPQWDCCHFGYSWIINDKKNTIGHDGTSSGWLTKNDYYPKEKYTIIILSNFGWADLDSISEKIEKLLELRK